MVYVDFIGHMIIEEYTGNSLFKQCGRTVVHFW